MFVSEKYPQHNNEDFIEDVRNTVVFGVIIYSASDKLLYASQNARIYLCISSSSFNSGSHIREILTAVYQENIRGGLTEDGIPDGESCHSWTSVQAEASWRRQSQTVFRNASNRWIRLAWHRQPSGVLINTITDITERKRLDLLRDAHSTLPFLYDDILDCAPGPIYVEGDDLRLVTANKTFCQLMGTEGDALIGRQITDVLAGENGAEVRMAARHVIETGVASVSRRYLVIPGRPDALARIRTRRIGEPGRYFIINDIQPQAEGDGMQAYRAIRALGRGRAVRSSFIEVWRQPFDGDREFCPQQE